jgi:hypothetical protein
MALAVALCLTLHAVTGVTNRSLRALVAGLLGVSYSASQASYDLRRLRLHGLIRRIHGRNHYTLTDARPHRGRMKPVTTSKNPTTKGALGESACCRIALSRVAPRASLVRTV